MLGSFFIGKKLFVSIHTVCGDPKIIAKANKYNRASIRVNAQ
ncbi:hypothetical protein CPS_1695 [Colwellia psychrerythraea 34H]|uniref:Uncharacterized protein n=1 Tax=Colwellia psychrerythraea (strain 34H / ATCC BAA-681) TaxID=167879 RepID=Q484T2_COLP3|nr:hypothetical protein CPS_1695 [Colwellia psychrerythraea 34H]